MASEWFICPLKIALGIGEAQSSEENSTTWEEKLLFSDYNQSGKDKKTRGSGKDSVL